jgi:hypothetical protein
MAPAVLYAYDANNLGTVLYSSNQAPGARDVAGNAVKFTTPTVTDGRVFVPDANSVTVYGLLSNGTTSDATPPAFDPATGAIFNSPQTVTLSDSTPGAVIYYTTNGSLPNTASAIYSVPIQITGPTTINAFATAPGYNASQVVSAFYTVQSSSTPLNPQFDKGFTASGLALNGGAKLNGTRLQLTDGGQYEARSAFYTTPVNIERFTTEFSFQLTRPISDGFTFTIQGAGLNALGSPASGLGFGPDASYHVSTFERSISRSVAVKFDFFDDAGEGNSSIGLFTNGVTPTIPAVNLLPSGIDLHSGHIYKARMVYDGAVLALTLSDTTNPSLVYSTDFTIDIPSTVGGSTAYVGFTAGTGISSSIQEILQWNFSPVL